MWVTPSPLGDDRVLELDGVSGAGEPRLAGAEEHWDQVDVDRVEEPQLEALAGDVGARDRHRLVAGDGLGLLDGARDAVGDEGERRVGVRPVGRLLVGDDEDGRSGGVASAPATGDVEKRPSADQGAEVCHGILELLGAGLRGVKLAAVAGHLRALWAALEPLEEVSGNVAVADFDEAVERHGHVGDDGAHGALLLRRCGQ